MRVLVCVGAKTGREMYRAGALGSFILESQTSHSGVADATDTVGLALQNRRKANARTAISSAMHRVGKSSMHNC